MPKIDFSQMVEIPEELQPIAGKSASLGSFVSTALGVRPREQLSLDQAYARGKLSHEVRQGGEHEISNEEMETIRKAVGEVYPPAAVYCVIEVLSNGASA